MIKRFGTAFAALVIISTVAFAQQEKTFTLSVSETQLNQIGKALGKQPYEDVASLIGSLLHQVQQQQAAAAKPKPEADNAEKPK